MVETGSVRFHRSLYDVDAVRAAVVAFADLAKLSLVESEHEVLLSIEQPHPQVAAMLADEIGNYALAETIARSRDTAAPVTEKKEPS